MGKSEIWTVYHKLFDENSDQAIQQPSSILRDINNNTFVENINKLLQYQRKLVLKLQKCEEKQPKSVYYSQIFTFRESPRILNSRGFFWTK